MFAVSKCAQAVSAALNAEAVDLDGTNDYFSRASDLVGNADGKTITFSAWVWVENNGTDSHTLYHSSSGRFSVQVTPTGLTVLGVNTSGTNVLTATVPLFDADIELRTFYHLLVSIDLSNTSRRFIYINDIPATVTWTTYTNTNIDFTQDVHRIGITVGGANRLKGRLSHVFLAYQYVDLSVEANRRIFITADRKPA